MKIIVSIAAIALFIWLLPGVINNVGYFWNDVVLDRDQIVVVQPQTENPSGAPAPQAQATTPVPSVPTPTPGSNQTQQYGFEIPKGRSKLVAAGWVCSGDIEVDSDRLYDDNPNSGLVVYFEKDGMVEAPWGAYCDTVNPQVMVDSLRQNGCSGGCQDVDRIYWR